MKKVYSGQTLAAVILEGDEIALVLKALKGWSPRSRISSTRCGLNSRPTRRSEP
jgi:hypothetical protein